MIYAMTETLLQHGESDILFLMVIFRLRTSLIAAICFCESGWPSTKNANRNPNC